MTLIALVLGQEINKYAVYSELRDYGMVAIGRVSARHFAEGSCTEYECTEDRYSVSYAFQVNGHKFSGMTYWSERYRDSNTGDSVNVLYMVNDPNINRIFEENRFDLVNSIVLVLVSPLFGLFVGFPIIWFIVYIMILPVVGLTRRFLTCLHMASPVLS